MDDASKDGPTPWGSLSPAERNELGKYLPQGKMREVMRGRDGELSAFLRLLRNWWDFYRDVLQRRGEGGLGEETQALESKRDVLDQERAALDEHTRQVKREQATALRAQGLEPGDSISRGGLAEVDPYAGQLVRRERRLNQEATRLHDKRSIRGARLNIITEMLRQLDDAGEVRQPDVFEESPASSLAHKRTVSIGRALIQHWKQNDGALPDTDSDGRPFYGSKGVFKEWAGKVVNLKPSRVYDMLKETGCWPVARQGVSDGLNEAVERCIQYARQNDGDLKLLD